MVSVRWVLDSRGKKVEAIVSRELFEEFIAFRKSMQIYSDPKTQRSLQKAENELRVGKYKKFSSAKEAIKWLKQK